MIKQNKEIENKVNILVIDNLYSTGGTLSEVCKVLRNDKNVTVFASKGIARNNHGNWQIENVVVDDNVKGFNFYATKDLSMAKSTDIDSMIWNGKSKGTFNNFINLLDLEKEVILYTY